MSSEDDKSGKDTKMMRAWTFTRRGLPTPDLLKLSDIPRPAADSLRPEEVLIKVHYSSIKPLFAQAIMHKFPHFTSAPWTAEMDFSGTIEAVGSTVNAHDKRFDFGDEVIGCADPRTYLKYGGSAQEYLIFPSDLVVKKPKNVSLAEAVALGSNACTVVQFLDALKLQPGDKVLVTAASGLLGSVLIPALRHTLGDGGVVIGVCSAANADTVRQYGADEVIDYNVTTDLATHLKQHHSSKPFNAIIDIAGASDALYTESPAYLDENGTFLFAGMVNTTHGSGGIFSVIMGVLRLRIKLVTPVILGGVPRRALFIAAKLDRQTLEVVKQQTESGLLQAKVAKVWEMEELLDAYALMLRGAGRGKHVLHVQD